MKISIIITLVALCVCSPVSGSWAILPPSVRSLAREGHYTEAVAEYVSSAVPSDVVEFAQNNFVFISFLKQIRGENRGSAETGIRRLLHATIVAVEAKLTSESATTASSGGDCLVQAEYSRILGDAYSEFVRMESAHGPSSGDLRGSPMVFRAVSAYKQVDAVAKDLSYAYTYPVVLDAHRGLAVLHRFLGDNELAVNRLSQSCRNSHIQMGILSRRRKGDLGLSARRDTVEKKLDEMEDMLNRWNRKGSRRRIMGP